MPTVTPVSNFQQQSQHTPPIAGKQTAPGSGEAEDGITTSLTCAFAPVHLTPKYCQNSFYGDWVSDTGATRSPFGCHKCSACANYRGIEAMLKFHRMVKDADILLYYYEFDSQKDYDAYTKCVKRHGGKYILVKLNGETFTSFSTTNVDTDRRESSCVRAQVAVETIGDLCTQRTVTRIQYVGWGKDPQEEFKGGGVKVEMPQDDEDIDDIYAECGLIIDYIGAEYGDPVNEHMVRNHWIEPNKRYRVWKFAPGWNKKKVLEALRHHSFFQCCLTDYLS